MNASLCTVAAAVIPSALAMKACPRAEDLGVCKGFELRNAAQIPPRDDGDGLHQFAAQLEPKLELPGGFPFRARSPVS